MIQFRADAQIDAAYTPEKRREVAEWALEGIDRALSLPAADDRRTALHALLDAAPYQYMRRTIIEAMLETLAVIDTRVVVRRI